MNYYKKSSTVRISKMEKWTTRCAVVVLLLCVALMFISNYVK